MRRSLVSPLSCSFALGSLRPGLPSDLLGFGHTETAIVEYNCQHYLSYHHILNGISDNFRKYILLYP